MAKLQFNKEPYFDDFEATKNYYEVLFKPSVALQTRELNQVQSILSNQTEEFANHIFKFGSMVRSGSVRLKNHQQYVRLKDLDTEGDATNVDRVIYNNVRGKTSGIEAEVFFTIAKTEFDPDTLYVNYRTTAVDGETSQFVNGETLEVLDDKGFVIYEVIVRCPTCTGADQDNTLDDANIEPTGTGSLFAVEEASFYVFGKFVENPQQMISLEKYGTTPTYKVGFDIIQSIVTSDDDPTLNDNALGSPNYVAPGADRYKITLNLIKKPLTDEDDENFTLLAKIEEGVLQEIRDKTEYADLMNTLARRTYDESGNYTTTPFTVNFIEHLKTDEQIDGWKLAENGGDETKIAIKSSEGKAYVKGREIDIIAERVTPAEKARDTGFTRSTVVRPQIGNYLTIELDSASNTIPNTNTSYSTTFNDYQTLQLFDGLMSGGNPTGNPVGTVRSKLIEIDSGVAGLDAVYRLYIFDIHMLEGKVISDALSIYISGGGNQTFGGNIKVDDVTGVAKIYETVNNNLLFKVPYEFTKSIRDADNALVSNTSVTITKKMVTSVNNSGQAVFLAEANESYMAFDANTWVGGLQTVTNNNYLPWDLTAANAITADISQISVNVGTGYIGKNFALTFNVLQSSIFERKKILNKKFLNNIASDVSVINLMTPDGYKLLSVIDLSDDSDITENYTLQTGEKDNYYDVATITLNAGLTMPEAGSLCSIEFEYLEHTGSGDFFSVDSYSTMVNDPDIDFTYEDIPSYTTNEGETYKLSDAIDFRPTIGADGTFAGVGAKLVNLPEDESNIIFDIEYYLSRWDTLCLLEDGNFFVVKGTPDLNPRKPEPAENSMGIYFINYKPYTFDVNLDVRMEYIDNKRYTMRDIGKLERRIGNLEYYVTFNMLEKETESLNVKDANGLDRFKNGFLVDNFKDYIASDTSNSEFTTAMDTERGVLAPSFTPRSVTLKFNESKSSNFQRNGEVLTLPYQSETWMNQPWASKSISVNPYFIYETEGSMKLSPDNDIWKDTTTAPTLNVAIDTGFEDIAQIANAAGVLGTQWNNWRTRSQQTNRSVSGRTTTTTTQTNQTRTGVNRTIEEQITNSSLGSSVTSVNLIPYIRRSEVQFMASNMLPNTILYAFFNDEPVTVDCRPINGSNSSPLVTDATGSIVGVFTIPNRSDKRFFTGKNVFRLTNLEDNSDDPDELTTSAEAQHYSGGLAETSRETVLAVTSPNLIERNTRQNRTLTSVSRRTIPVRRSGDDPIAQSFSVAESNGVFLTGADLYFSAKTTGKEPAWFQIRNMTNGYPNSIIVPYSEVTLKPENVNVSSDGTIPTHFEFSAPVFLQPDEEYCFVVGSSIETYRIFISKLGGETVGSNPVTISTQPHLGSMFKSQNDQTWSASQFEDVKFKLYRAEFDVSSSATGGMDLVFDATEIGLKEEMKNNPLETEEGSRMVRVYQKNHGYTKDVDQVKLEILSDTWFDFYLQSGTVVVGQKLGSSNGSGIVNDLEFISGNDWRIKLSELVGMFVDGEQVVGNVYYEDYNDESFIKALDIAPIPQTHSVAIGNFPTGVDNTFNGIPLIDLSTPLHYVQAVDSLDSYVIQVDTPATKTGMIGGKGIKAVCNVAVDTLQVQSNFIDFEGNMQWRVEGVTHTGVGGNGGNYLPVPEFNIMPFENVHLEQPMKIPNYRNSELNLGVGVAPITVACKVGSEFSYLSPVLKIGVTNLITITNRVEWNDCETYSIEPNAGTWPIDDCIGEFAESNARWKTEKDPKYGSETAKYLCKQVSLKNPATNIKLYMDMLKFLYNDIEIWFRTVPSDVEDSIDTIEWQQAFLDQDVVSETSTDFKETETTIPNNVGGVLPEFKAFQIKLILRSKNSAQPPAVQNFRALAIT